MKTWLDFGDINLFFKVRHSRGKMVKVEHLWWGGGICFV